MEVHRDAYAAVMKSFSLGELSWVRPLTIYSLTTPIKPLTKPYQAPSRVGCRINRAAPHSGDTTSAQPPYCRGNRPHRAIEAC
jgi:hypothetical protein